MLKPISWMFRVENFKKHFLILSLVELSFFSLAILLLLIFANLPETNYHVTIAFIIVILIAFFIPCLFVSGYFWELTDCIISRKIDILPSSIYNGKIKSIDSIELPKIEIFKFLWRGIASIVATIILLLPIGIIFLYLSKSAMNIMELYNLSVAQSQLLFFLIIIFMCLFIPGLLYNYAARNSIFAVLNLPKATFLMGNYTFSYLKNAFLIFIFSLIYSYIMKILSSIPKLSLNTIDLANTTGFLNNVYTIIAFIMILISTIVVRIYFVFVNAYLLGTIAPKDEL